MKYILILLLLCSCGGTRQVTNEKHEDFTIENNYSEGSKIVLGNSFIYTPFDALKPMKIEGKVYENAIVSNDKSITKESYKNFNVYHHYNVYHNKGTEKSDNTILWIGIAFVIMLGVLAWLKLPSFKV
jgi:hypothetical protein